MFFAQWPFLANFEQLLGEIPRKKVGQKNTLLSFMAISWLSKSCGLETHMRP